MTIRPLSPELAEKARVELNEDPSRLKEDLQYIKDWIAQQPHLIARTDDQWLVAFLRGCKFSLERTKEKLDLYYSMRSITPELTIKIPFNDPKFMEIMSLGVMLVLPKSAGATSPRVGIFRIGAYDPYKYSISDIICVVNSVQKISFLEDDQLIVSGVRSIMDMKDANMGHFTQMTPMTTKKMVTNGQDAAPMRMKGVHYLNTPVGFETVFNMVKGFLNEKNKSRLYVHNKNYDEMYQYIPKEILPTEYGGNGGSLQSIIDYWKAKVIEYSSWLEEDMKYGTDESKRPGKPKTAEGMFGLEGSFRQLQFD